MSNEDEEVKKIMSEEVKVVYVPHEIIKYYDGTYNVNYKNKHITNPAAGRDLDIAAVKALRTTYALS